MIDGGHLKITQIHILTAFAGQTAKDYIQNGQGAILKLNTELNAAYIIKITFKCELSS